MAKTGRRRRTARIQMARLRGGGLADRADRVAVEEPMEVRIEAPSPDGGAVERPVAVTMRTPGDDFELAAGFVVTEGVVTSAEAVAGARYCRNATPQEYNVVTVSIRDPKAFDAAGLVRNFYVASSCGVCGKGSLEAVEVMAGRPAVASGEFAVSEAAVRALPGALRAAQKVFDRTGGIHAAGLFDSTGRMVLVREDVARHNAVDKVAGRLVLSRELPAPGLGLVVSGRSSFDSLQKAAMAGFPMVVAVGAATSLAVDFARRFNMTLTGFTDDGGCNVYAGAQRIVRKA